MAQLHFLDGPLSGKRARLKGRRIAIGRDLNNDIRIDHPSVSPRHVVLTRDEDDGYLLQIDASRPPVAINGKQVVKAKLKDRDQIQIGGVHVQYLSGAVPQPEQQKLAYNPLDFWSDAPPPKEDTRSPEDLATHQDPSGSQEVISLDDVEDLTDSQSKPVKSWKKTLAAVLLLLLMLGGSVFLFRKDLWKEKPKPAETAQNGGETSQVNEPEKGEDPKPPEPDPPVPKFSELPLPIGTRESGLKADAKLHHTRNYKSHQEAVDAAQPGDSVIFDSNDPNPIVVQKPIRDVQFISGWALWELHADVIDCQFIFHELRRLVQGQGKLERCAFFRCPMKRTRLTHADAVSFYFDERCPLSPKDNQDNGRTPILQLTGFVRNVLIHKPFAGALNQDKLFAMNWAPSIRIHATHPEGDGRGTYILSPVVLGQRAWTPHEIVRGNGVTYAHLSADHGVWADPVLNVMRGNDCVILCTSIGGESPVATEQFAALPRKIKYFDHEEFGHDLGPAFRGAAMTIQGQRTRIVGHGDPRKPWSIGQRQAIPGFHYADGIVAADPFLRQFATPSGGLSLNFAEPRGVFVMGPGQDGAEVLSARLQPDGSPMYPLDGPDLHQPTFVALKDLRIDAGLFDKMKLADFTKKPMPEIEKALAADQSIFLGPGTYEFKQPLRAGFVAGAGMEKTILNWPETVDCSQRNCRGMINCTVSGGRHGHNSQAGVGQRFGSSPALFLRTRFTGQKETGINLHTSQFQTFQDCEFVGCRNGFGNGLDKSPGAFKGDKGAMGGVTIDNLNLCNCTFRQIKHRAIDLTPDSPHLGHVGIHNCLFEDVGETAIRIEGGQTHLVQQCRFARCSSQTYVPAINIVSHGVVALSHLDVDCSTVKGNPECVSLRGLAVVSRCSIQSQGITLKCDGLLAADHVTALSGTLSTRKESLLWHCRFKNMDLPDGVALATEKDFMDVSPISFAVSLDRTPPPEVTGLKIRTVNKQRRIEWEAATDPESGIVQYIIFSGDREIGRTPFQNDQPSDVRSPLLKPVPIISHVDPNPDNKNYSVVAVNGAGLMSNGKEALPRRIGPARATYRGKDEDEVMVIKDFVNVKGKITQIVAEDGKKYPLAKFGKNGGPNIVYFEQREVAEGP